MDKLYVADTNILLDAIENLKGYKIVLLSSTLRELEKHKSSHDENLKYNARRVSRFIRDHIEDFYFDTKDYDGSKLGRDYDNTYQDNNILMACVDNQYGLITNDVLLGYKAKGFNLEVINLNSEIISSKNTYTGIRKIYLSKTDEKDQEELAKLYEQPELNTYDLLVNQYLIIYNKDTNEVIDKFRFNGEKLVKLEIPAKKVIKAKNEEQECALDLLFNTEIPIRIIAGSAGSGKTYLTVKSAIHHVMNKGNHAKIMVVRNPIGSGETIGWLKGTKEDKTQDFFKPFVQHLEGGEQEAALLETRGQLIREIPYYIKGLSIDDTFVVVDEAEDLDKKLIKLIGSRLGENSSITFTGDFKQAEGKYIENNGLLYAIDILKGNPLVGIVILDEDVRSEASKVFADM